MFKDRSAHVTRHGIVAHYGTIHVEGVPDGLPWHCYCTPDHGHDHDALHDKVVEKLKAREASREELGALVGRGGRIGLVKWEINDCIVQTHAPSLWRLYVGWTESPLGAEARHRVHTADYEHPAGVPSADKILEMVSNAVTSAGHTHAKSVRMAGEFVSAR